MDYALTFNEFRFLCHHLIIKNHLDCVQLYQLIWKSKFKAILVLESLKAVCLNILIQNQLAWTVLNNRYTKSVNYLLFYYKPTFLMILESFADPTFSLSQVLNLKFKYWRNSNYTYYIYARFFYWVNEVCRRHVSVTLTDVYYSMVILQTYLTWLSATKNIH